MEVNIMKEKIADKYKAMQTDLETKMNTGKIGNLSLSDLYSICDCGKQLLKRHAVKTIIKNVAEYFKSFGFMVTMDFDNVNYVIVEA